MLKQPHVLAAWHAGANDRLRAENTELTERLQRLAPVLTSMVHDLAAARRENAALRRENLRLRALLAGSPAGVADPAAKTVHVAAARVAPADIADDPAMPPRIEAARMDRAGVS